VVREETAEPLSFERERAGDALVHSFPLVLSALALFVGGYVTWSDAPTAGPRIFPLWILLMTLGLVAAAGAIISFLVSDAGPFGARARRTSEGGGPIVATRTDFGRPRPAATPATAPSPNGGLAVAMASLGSRPATPAVWSEDDLPLAPPRPAVRTTVPVAGSTVTPRSGSAPVSQNRAAIESALAELDDIQRDTTPRRVGERAASP
jgi:hypothetical protein